MGKNRIFISYRRQGGYEFANQLYERLTKDNYRVNFDMNTFESGSFKKQIFKQIDQAKDFILVVDKYAFDRTLDSSFDQEHDWLRKELAYAIKKKKNIIPIFLSGISSFPRNLPADISEVSEKTSLIYDHYTDNDFYNALKHRFIKSSQKIGPGGWAFIIIGTIIGYFYMTNNTNNNQYISDQQYSGQEYVDAVTDAPNNVSTSDVINIINQFFSNSHSWDVFAGNEALIPESNGMNYGENGCSMTFTCKLTYNNHPFLPHRNGEPSDWRILVLGSESSPQYLFLTSETINAAEPHNAGQYIADDLHLKFTGHNTTPNDPPGYYALYENSAFAFIFYARPRDNGLFYVLEFTTIDLKGNLIIPSE